jgi:hypothetical protein
VRWLVVDTGTWLPGRKVLIHPSAIADVDYESEQIITPLARKQVEGSPNLRDDQRLSKDMEMRLFSHYGWSADWGASPFASASEAPPAVPGAVGGSVEDPYLRSFEAIKGCRLRATDDDREDANEDGGDILDGGDDDRVDGEPSLWGDRGDRSDAMGPGRPAGS